MARISVPIHAFTGLSSNGSWPPELLAISQITNQTKVMPSSVAATSRRRIRRAPRAIAVNHVCGFRAHGRGTSLMTPGGVDETLVP
jgi:hypothetical protein